ncbi:MULTISPECIES: DNA-processing protein DprA [unclassified Gemella]|uniref:DNA-processing protein DprA n=1 Tax=unclassified Gemella TaxID=2624949 RepID=UPI0015D079CD|nr:MULTISPECIES: DNA-processing protein DprA [unclassified Gemella]MBF0710424.1 DNA-protecting protein DprA [Gemella sp. GL1.1]NYS27768.1 DNA-protecting protein DprA [Gemella sp. GL1]
MNREELLNKKLNDMEKRILLSLVAIEKVTSLKIHKILGKLEKIEEIAKLNRESFIKLFGKNSDDIYEKFHNNMDFNYDKYFKFYKTNYLFFDSEYYPQNLFKLYDFPFILFYRGNKDLLLFKRKISIVGTRHNTSYSDKSLDQIVPYLVKNNFVTVSGIASGVDRLVHEKTIKNKGYTIGIIGHGHNTIYPEENIKLYEEMKKNHIIVSEYFPTSGIRKYRFLERNRLVAAFGLGLLVTEAASKSGTSRTIDYALDIGNSVFCLPGRFGDKMSGALNEHIKSGAILFNKLSDLNDELRFKS